MKNRIFFLHILLLPLVGVAQDQVVPTQLSLEKAVQIGLANNLSIKRATIQTQLANAQVSEEQWRWIPEIYGSFDVKRNLIVPITPVPAIAFNPSANPDDITPMRFSSNWSSSAGINLNYPFFDPQRVGKTKQLKLSEKIQQQEALLNEKDVKYTIENDYVACLIAQKQLELAVVDTLQKNQLQSITAQKLAEGKITQLSMNQVTSELNQSVRNYWLTRKVYVIAKVQLLADMGLDITHSDNLHLTDDLELFEQKYLQNSLIDPTNERLNLLKNQQELTAMELKQNKLGFAPTFYLKGYLGANFYDNQFRFFDASRWYGNSYVSLGMNVPITQGLSRVKSTSILALKLNQQQLEYLQEIQNDALKHKKNQEEVLALTNALNAAKKDYQLNEQNWNTMKAQFEIGRISTVELVQGNAVFQQAKANYLQSLYEWMLARMELER